MLYIVYISPIRYVIYCMYRQVAMLYIVYISPIRYVIYCIYL